MFVVLAYDVNQKRVGKILRICRKYLVHMQKSVFEGIITEGSLSKMKRELSAVIDYDEDSICIYSMTVMQSICKEQIGVSEEHSNII